MRVLLTIIAILTALTVYGQFNRNSKAKNQDNLTGDGQTVFTDENGNKITPAYFAGGMAKFYSYIGKKLKYPKDAKQNKIEGKVFVSFVVGKDGYVKEESVTVIKGVYPTCDNEAIRVIKNSPKWVPGTNHDTGEKIETKMALPVV